ncbi:hypothetical protein M8994_06720, partial [Brucella sp. 21LCYQ03]|nr:hypothetical protein [Brucella sp. 21LCYQ03]
PVARQAHNLKAAGSNPAPATKAFPKNTKTFDAYAIHVCCTACASFMEQPVRAKIDNQSIFERSHLVRLIT